MATARRAEPQAPAPGDTTPSPPASARAADIPLQYARGVGPARARLFERLGLRTVADLLYHLPRRLEDRSRLRAIADLDHGAVETIQAVVGRVNQFRPRRRRGLVITRAALADRSGILHAVWYNQPYLARQLTPGRALILHGRVQRQAGEIQMIAPEFEPLEAGEETLHAGRIVPVYPSTEGLSQRLLRTVVFHALDDHAAAMEEWLPPPVRGRHRLPDLETALKHAHFPDTPQSQEAARRRLVYEELLLLQLLLFRQKMEAQAEPRAVHYGHGGDLVARFHAALPFPLTGAQRRAVAEIASDLARPYPMNRLLQGDVGSGKTLVAASALLFCAGGGAQGALMAPTEILAEQHALTLRRLLEPLGVTVVLLVGGLPRAARQEALQQAADGRADVVIGTHALIEGDVAFHRLGLVVVDEQHRFGVGQRAALRSKGERPDVLVMTATPIPRTLALTLYGDLDVSTLDELPPGRPPIKTHVRSAARRPQVYAFVREEVLAGRQAYVVCPLIEESDKLQAEAATQLAARLEAGVLHGLRIGVLHGRMRVEERDAAMRALRDGALGALVATTVIEVGIDVPNASVMVIEDADRFGLSQLHQLRGRVGRGAHQAHCILIADPKPEDETARARLAAMAEESDGFRIAQRDLELRGTGELLGRGRQHGLSDLRVADLLRDYAWLERARRDAAEILTRDPALTERRHRPLAQAMRRRFGAANAENARVG